MYAKHQPTLSAFARANPDGLSRVAQFCIASARERFFNMPAIMSALRKGDDSAMYGHKAFSVRWHQDSRESVWTACEQIWELPEPRRVRADYLLRYLADLPGLNVAKAGFVCQIAYGVSGCIDTVNFSRFTVPRGIRSGSSAWRMKAQTTPQRRLRLAQRYNALIQQCGGTASLWNSWCHAMVERYPSRFPTAEHASALHLECIL